MGFLPERAERFGKKIGDNYLPKANSALPRVLPTIIIIIACDNIKQLSERQSLGALGEVVGV